MSVLRGLWFLALLCGSVSAQGDVVVQAIADARRQHEAGQDEDAALTLRSARVDLAAIDDAAIRRRLEKSIDTLLGEVDPLDDATTKATDAAARALLKPAQAYLRRKWARVALPVLEAAAEFSDKIAGKALADARAAVGVATPRGSASQIDEWFGNGKSFAGGGYWKVQKGVVESPELGTDSVGFRSEKTTTGPVRISIEALASDSPSKASLVFAMDPSVNGDDYYIVELRHARGFSQLRLLHCTPAGNLDEIVTQPVTFARAERADWIRLSVELRGDRIRIAVGDDLESAESRSVTPDLDGRIGLFVSGDSAFKAPVRFRNLSVERL